MSEEGKPADDVANQIDRTRRQHRWAVERAHHRIEQHFQRIEGLVEKRKPTNQFRIELKSDTEARNAHAQHPPPRRAYSARRPFDHAASHLGKAAAHLTEVAAQRAARAAHLAAVAAHLAAAAL